MGIPFHIHSSALVTLFGRPGRIIETDGQGYVFEHLETPGLTERITFDDFQRLLETPNLRIEHDHGAIGSRALEEKHGSSSVFIFLPPEEQMEVLWSQACCDAFLSRYMNGSAKKTDASINANRPQLRDDAEVRFGSAYENAKLRAGDNTSGKKFPSSRTLRKWLKAYERAGYRIDGLVRAHHRSGNRLQRFSLEEAALMMQVVEHYASKQKPTQKKAIQRTRDLFHSENIERQKNNLLPLKVPSKTKLRSVIKAQGAFYLKVRRDGIAAARREFTFKSKGVQAEIPVERVETDENKLDVINICAPTGLLEVLPPERIRQLEKGRRWLYAYIDCATKCILSLHLAEGQSGEAAVRSLRNVLRDKTAIARAFGCKHTWEMRGRPFSIVADHGAAFHSEAFNLAAASLGIGVEHPPVGQPHLRGTIESIFKTHGHLLMSHLVGRTFSNTKERGDYPSEDLACLSDDELIGLIISVMIDIYHHQPHEALDGHTPAQMWERKSKANMVPVPPDGHEIRAALGHVHERSVNNAGVTFACINYECPELRDAYLQCPGQKVTIRVDYEDLGWITVDLGERRFAAEACWDVFKGMSLMEWKATRREILKRKAENETINRQTVIDTFGRLDSTVRTAMLRACVTLNEATIEDVERENRYLRLPLEEHNADPDTPLSDLINPPAAPTDPFATAQEIKPPSADNELRPRAGKNWEFDDE